MKRALIGAGGYSHDLLGLFGNLPRFVDEQYWKPNNDKIFPLSEFDPAEYEVQVAIADPADRKRVVERLPKETRFFTFVHRTAQPFGPYMIKEGTTIGPSSVLMYGASVGKHCIINTNVVLGHDSMLGDFVTMSPRSGVMGNCNIGNQVFFGAGALCRERVAICDNVTIGMGGMVVKDITESGVYVGVPVTRIK